MLDFIESVDDIPFWLSFLYIIAPIFLYIMFYRDVHQFRKRFTKYNKRTLGLFVFMVIFSLFYCFGNDYFGYRNIVVYDYYNNLEELIKQIIAYCNGNYELFRFIIFGGTIFLIYCISHVMKINSYFALLFWFLLYYNVSFYARASLAMAIYFLGLALVVTKKTRNPFFWIGIGILISSVLFHRELIVAIALTPIIFIPLTAKNFKWIILLLLLIIVPISLFIMNNPTILAEVSDNESYNQKMDLYIESSINGLWAEGNIRGYISLFMQYAYMFGAFYLISIRILSKKTSRYITHSINKLYTVTFGIVLVSIIMYIVFGQYNIYFYRIFYISLIPTGIILAYLFIHRLLKVKWILYLFTIVLLSRTISWLTMLYHYF